MNKFATALVSTLAFSGVAAYGQVTATKKAPTPISASYINEVVGPTLTKDDSKFQSYHYFTVKSKFTESGWGLSFVGRADSTFGDGAEKQETTEGDHYIKVHTPALKTEYVTITPQVRAYFPASESSRDANRDVIYNPRVYVTGSVGNVDLTYILLPYTYSYTDTLNAQQIAKNDSEAIARRINYAQGHYFAANYNIGSSTTLDLEVYPKWTYREGSAVQYNDFNFTPGVSQKFSDTISGSLWIDSYGVNYAAAKSSLGATLSVVLL